MDYFKYPRTYHLPWSPGVQADDKIIRDLSNFQGKEIVVTEKMDGENTTMYSDHIHARSLDSRGGEERAWVKGFWATIASEIPEGWRICGENLWAKHSIPYTNLESYFYGFSVWDSNNVALPWGETLEWFDCLGITPVRNLYRGVWNPSVFRNIENGLDLSVQEGYVVRIADGFKYGDFSNHVAKYVRRDHVQATSHWTYGSRFTPNRLSR